MNLLWSNDKALSRTEIIELSPDKSWKPSSIHILLNSLLKKEAIEVQGFVRTGKNYGRTYSATVTKEGYLAMQFMKTYPEQSVARGSLPGLVAALIDTEEADAAVLDELVEIIEKKRQRLRN